MVVFMVVTTAAQLISAAILSVSSALVSWRLVVDRLSVLFLHLLLSLQRLQHLLWWLLELHIVKIVSSYIIWVCVKEVRLSAVSPSVHLPVSPLDPSVSLQVCLFNLVFVLCVGVSLPCRGWRPLLSGFCTVWTCVVTVCKMLYQLSVVQPNRYSSNCTMVTMTTASPSLITPWDLNL